MRIIGIDYGSKNIGIALTDESGEWAFPHSVIPNDKHMFASIKKISEEKGVKEIVIGESKDYKGKMNEVMAAASEFANSLAADGFTIHFEPEFLSSHQAQHIQGTKNMIDASAATIILQSFLDKRKNNVQSFLDKRKNNVK